MRILCDNMEKLYDDYKMLSEIIKNLHKNWNYCMKHDQVMCKQGNDK